MSGAESLPVRKLQPLVATAALVFGAEVMKSVGADLVINVEGDLVHVLIPFSETNAGTPYAFRLTFTVDQLGALMDELVEAADLVTS